MAGAENRPFSGTWNYNNKKIRRHVPDCIVKFNGETAMPSCVGCVGSIDLQDLITSVSISNSTDTAPGSCSITLEIPSNRRSCFWRDNKFKLHTGLEVHVFIRGYFSHTDLADPDEDSPYNLDKATMKPYYQVFNGVVTDVSFNFGGGFYSASLNCADFLHFWQYQSINSNPAALGSKVDGDKTQMNFTGHAYTRKNPYSVVHELYSSGHGDAGSHDFVLSDFTTIGVKSDLFQDSFWEVTGYYWHKRFQQPMGNLKMYGADGRLFNTMEQFMVSSDLIKKGEANMTSDKWHTLGNPSNDKTKMGTIDTYMESLLTILRHSRGKDGQKTDKKDYAFPAESLFYVDNTTWAAGGSASEKGRRGYNVAGVTAFALDIGQLGQVNLFESQMTTKMDLASQVSTEIGFEFFIDFNGDYVFKPPLYNLDTSQSRVYVVRDIDLISFSASEKEPECTVMKGTGGYFNNMASLFGKEYENRGLFVDWRNVAKYGWREGSFETTYLNDPKSIYYAAMNRMALQNKDIHSGSCSIPLRPEMKMGFPVYIEPFDCFYYVSAISHTFSYGGDCTTDLTLTAKRAKFYPPMNKSGQFPKVEEIDLLNIYKPNHPLFTRNDLGQPKYIGLPCVVLGLDLSNMNPLWWAYGEVTNFLMNMTSNTTGKTKYGDNYEGILTLVRAMAEFSNKQLTYGMVSKKEAKNGLNYVTIYRDVGGTKVSRNITFKRLVGVVKKLRADVNRRIDTGEWKSYTANQTLVTGDFLQTITASTYGKDAPFIKRFFEILEDVRVRQSKWMQGGEDMKQYLASLKYMKQNFRPDDQHPGSYRYYSSAIPNDHPEARKFMGMANIYETTTKTSIKEKSETYFNTSQLVHTLTTPRKNSVKLVDMKDGTYQIVDPNDPDQKGTLADSLFETAYGIPIRTFNFNSAGVGVNNNRTYEVRATQDIKTIVFSVQYQSKSRGKTFKIDSLVTVSSALDKGLFRFIYPNPKTVDFTKLKTLRDIFGDETKGLLKTHLGIIQSTAGIYQATFDEAGATQLLDDAQILMGSAELEIKWIIDSSKYAKINTWRDEKGVLHKNEPKLIWDVPILQKVREGGKTQTKYQYRTYQRMIKLLEKQITKAVELQSKGEILTAQLSGNFSGFMNSEDRQFEGAAQVRRSTRNGAELTDKGVVENTIINDMEVIKKLSAAVVADWAVPQDPKLKGDPSNPDTCSYEVHILSKWPKEVSDLVVASHKKVLESVLNQKSSVLGSYIKYKKSKVNFKFHSGVEPYYSPVLPISDEKGFEHFGTYAYGRGLTLRGLAEIMELPTEMWANLSPQELNTLYGVIGAEKSINSTAELKALEKQGYIRRQKNSWGYNLDSSKYGVSRAEQRLSQAYNSFGQSYRTTLNESIANYIGEEGAGSVLSTAQQEAMTNAGYDPNRSDAVLAYLETYSNSKDPAQRAQATRIFEQAFVQNVITSANEYGKAISAQNVPIELARLDTIYSPTQCNGGAANALDTSDAFQLESDQFSFAYGTGLSGGFSETSYLQALSSQRVVDWKSHQEALRGEMQQEETITWTQLKNSFKEFGRFQAFRDIDDALTAIDNEWDSLERGWTPFVEREDLGQAQIPKDVTVTGELMPDIIEFINANIVAPFEDDDE